MCKLYKNIKTIEDAYETEANLSEDVIEETLYELMRDILFVHNYLVERKSDYLNSEDYIWYEKIMSYLSALDPTKTYVGLAEVELHFEDGIEPTDPL